VSATIERLRLGEYADRRAGRLSLGNKQRLGLARAILHRPDLLVLDEPGNALDPAGMVEIRGLLRQLATEDGVAVLLSSHILAEVVHLADQIGIVHGGRLVEELSRHELAERERSHLRVGTPQPGRAAELLTRAGFPHLAQAEGEVRVLDADGRQGEIARVLVGAGVELTELTRSREDLESYFLRLTGGRT
jgi:ABC-2 type transport system ATP-binding protein